MFMRISHTDLLGDAWDATGGGTGASEFVPLATALFKHIRAIHVRLDTLADAIKANGDDITTIASHTHTVSSGTAAVSTALASVMGDDPTTGDYPFDFSYYSALQPDDTDGDYDGGSDKLKSGIFRVSDLSYKDQQDL
jgi:hypothetical protein